MAPHVVEALVQAAVQRVRDKIATWWQCSSCFGDEPAVEDVVAAVDLITEVPPRTSLSALVCALTSWCYVTTLHIHFLGSRHVTSCRPICVCRSNARPSDSSCAVRVAAAPLTATRGCGRSGCSRSPTRRGRCSSVSCPRSQGVVLRMWRQR
jgi:hypothetical protein